MPIRILIADSDPLARNHLREIAVSHPDCEIMSSARDGQETIQLAAQFHPDIALISWNLPGISGPKTCEILNALYPDIMSILITVEQSQNSTEAALYSGARALVQKDIQPRRLLDLIDTLSDVRSKRTSSEYMEWKDLSKHPRVISVTGAKGGIGKTTIAVNLACTLAKRAPGKVALIDMHSQFGDIPTMLNIHPERALIDMIPISSEIDEDLVQSFAAKHQSSVHVLVTAIKPSPLDSLSTEFLDNVLYVLKRTYRYIVIDVPAILQEVTIHTLAHSSIILLVANLFDLTTAADTMKLAAALEDESIPNENIAVVVNRVSKSNQIHSKDMIKMFHGKTTAFLPNDNRMVTAVNKGMPLAVSCGDCAWMRSMEELSDLASGAQITAAPAALEKTNSGLRWWRVNGTE